MSRRKRLPIEELAPYLYPPPSIRPATDADAADVARDESQPAAPSVVVSQPQPTIDWLAMFGNDHPVEIEVGFGKGAFLVSSAVARPDTNFFGIEIERKYQLLTAGRLASRGLSHVRVCAADAKQWFSQLIPPQSVAVVHVYFPDPWWKRRHHKRRLFTLDFAQDCLKVLKLDGVLSIATDVAEYFVMMQETLAQIPEFSVIPLDPTIPGSNVETNFERKARMVGTPINRARYRKTAEAPPRPAPSPEVAVDSTVGDDSAD